MACSTPPDSTETEVANLYATLEAAGTPFEDARATLETEFAKTAVARSETAVALALKDFEATVDDPKADKMIQANETAIAGFLELERYRNDPKGIEIIKANPTVAAGIEELALEVIETSTAYFDTHLTAVAEAQTNAIAKAVIEQDTKQAATALAEGYATTFNEAFETALAETNATVEALLKAQE